MADVLVTHSYHLAYDPKQVRKMQPYMPLGTLYAAAALRARGFAVVGFDPMLEAPGEALDLLLQEHQPKIVVVYEDDFNFLSKMCLTRMRDLAWRIASAAHDAGAVAVAHGSDSTDHSLLFLQNGFDYVLCGEAEETLAQLCSSILQSQSVPELDGLVRLDQHGRLARSVQRLARNTAWPELPLPARDLIDAEAYRAAWTSAHGYFSANVVASRGCPYRCNWCAKPISGNVFQLRPAAAVAEEVSLLKTEFGVQHIWFADDVFALNQHWVRDFAEEVWRRDAVVPFKIQSRANLMTQETVRHLKNAGCAEVWMGVESGSQAVLDAMDKGLRLSNVIDARERLGDAGIRACYFLQFGYPGERWTELQETIALVRRTRPDDIGISFSYPLPGTVFYERVRAQLGEKQNWTDSDDLCIMFHAAYGSDFYRAVRDALHAEVNSWGSPDERRRSEVRAMWQHVEEMEPVSRDPLAFCSPDAAAFDPAAFVGLEQLLSTANGSQGIDR